MRIARANGTKLIAVPGDATWDAALAAESTVSASRRESSGRISSRADRRISRTRCATAAHLIGEGDEPPEATALSSAGVYAASGSRTWATLSPQEARRALTAARRSSSTARSLQAGQTEPVDALCAALAERGLTPLPLYVSSLKAKEDAAFVEAQFAAHDPAIVLNATAFALSQPGRRFAGTVLDGGDAPGPAGDVRRRVGRRRGRRRAAAFRRPTSP